MAKRIVSLEVCLKFKDIIDRIEGRIPFDDLEKSRAFVLKFNGLSVWSIKEL